MKLLKMFCLVAVVCLLAACAPVQEVESVVSSSPAVSSQVSSQLPAVSLPDTALPEPDPDFDMDLGIFEEVYATLGLYFTEEDVYAYNPDFYRVEDYGIVAVYRLDNVSLYDTTGYIEVKRYTEPDEMELALENYLFTIDYIAYDVSPMTARALYGDLYTLNDESAWLIWLDRSEYIDSEGPIYDDEYLPHEIEYPGPDIWYYAEFGYKGIGSAILSVFYYGTNEGNHDFIVAGDEPETILMLRWKKDWY